MKGEGRGRWGEKKGEEWGGGEKQGRRQKKGKGWGRRGRSEAERARDDREE